MDPEDEKIPPAFFDEETIKAAERYGLTIGIVSLQKLVEGWPLFGKHKDIIAHGPKGEVRGRIVGIIGEFKSGKTWLLQEILGPSVDLVHHQSIHTPGICMTFAETLEGKDQKKNEAGARSTTSGGRRGGGGGRRGGGNKTSTRTEAAKSVNEYDYIFFDSAGDAAAASECKLNDVRCTEVFIRKLLVELSDKLIFVTSKFNRPVQVQIHAALEYLRQVNAARGVKKSFERLLVVHNMIEVITKEVLEQRIQEVKKIYEDDEEQIYNPPTSGDNNKKPEKLWVENQETILVDGQNHKFFFYDTKNTTHIFIVRQGDKSKEDEHWRYVNNYCALNVIKTNIRFGQASKNINLIDEVLRISNRELPTYLRKYDKELVLKDYNGYKYLYPEPKVAHKKDDDDEDEPKEDEEVEPDAEEDVDDSGPSPLFELREDMKFTDMGVESESDKRLRGDVNITPKEFEVCVVIPGVDPSQIKMRTYEHKLIRVEVVIPDPFNREQHAEDYQTWWGKNYFEWRAPSKQRFCNLRLKDKEEREKRVSYVNGLYKVRLLRENDEEDNEEEEVKEKI